MVSGRVCLSFAALVLFAAIGVGHAAPLGDRQAELLHRLKHDCGSCHGMTMKGGLGPPLLPEALASRSDEGLAEVILHGVPGTPMPPWQSELTREEALWIARLLQKGVLP